ncbi:hypothetical protein [Flavobacterium silvaticum]|uniref:Uncharacterized protein n=1 Tax=Flavobacterium silvaticum TaxID=1852020 RepID=A0A972FS78_9FLAO|nr:hypothetical protein [Flavobacterium silvaticum]NMH26570.1 hypothetical protein [Flavobacterium silvaticum]
MKRLILYTKDIQQLTGRSERHCRDLYKRILSLNGKESPAPLTVYDFSAYSGIPVNAVLERIN